MENSDPIESEQLLFALLRQGNSAAFEKIYRRYWSSLYTSAYKRLPDKEKCKDIIQNVFMSLWTRREEITIDNPVAYLHTAVRFQVLKHISRDPRAAFFNETFEREIISPLASDASLLEKEAKMLIQHYIEALPKKRRHIFILYYFEGLSTANIAVRLNVSRKTVQNQLHTASHALRLKLTQFLVLLLSVWLSW